MFLICCRFWFGMEVGFFGKFWFGGIGGLFVFIKLIKCFFFWISGCLILLSIVFLDLCFRMRLFVFVTLLFSWWVLSFCLSLLNLLFKEMVLSDIFLIF